MEITSIIQHVFKQPSLEGVSLAELEKFTARQPFFAVGQYLLLKKMQDIRDPGFEKQLQKTRLYFENPLWLQQLLLRKTDEAIVTQTQEELSPVEAEQTAIENDLGSNGIFEEQPGKIKHLVHSNEDNIVEEITSTEVVDDIFTDGPGPSESADPLTKDPDAEIIPATQPVEEVQQVNMVELPEREAGKSETEIINEPALVEPIIASSSENQSPETGIETDSEIRGTGTTNNQANINETEKEEEGKPGFVLPPYSKPPEQIENQLVFQAYHTIDYFASQGIKISNKAEMSDKLGSQLKSFTEWLKTMKRLPPSKMEQQMEEKESEVVIEMAAHSLESKEVLTETMAEVLLKQGKKESAIEVYNKLSLLNPSKTPYFAAKIEEIKRN